MSQASRVNPEEIEARSSSSKNTHDESHFGLHPPIAGLLGDILNDALKLIRQEAALAHFEFQSALGKVFRAASFVAAGLILGGLGLLLLSEAVVSILHGDLDVPLWCSYLIVSVLPIGLGIGLYRRGKAAAGTVDFLPRNTWKNVKENMEWMRNRT